MSESNAKTAYRATTQPRRSCPCLRPWRSCPCPRPRQSYPCPRPQRSCPCPQPRRSCPCPHTAAEGDGGSHGVGRGRGITRRAAGPRIARRLAGTGSRGGGRGRGITRPPTGTRIAWWPAGTGDCAVADRDGKREVRDQGMNLPDALPMPPRRSRGSSLPESPVGLCGGDVQKYNRENGDAN